MTENTTYTCACCGKTHDNWPALNYSSPSHYLDLNEQEKQQIATLDNDFCTIEHQHQTDRFIRCVLLQKVIDHCSDLNYGLWVSLSEKSFDEYSVNFQNQIHETEYFGWLCNDLPDYENSTLAIPMTVFTQKGNQRPEIIPHEEFDHAFVRDYYTGISKSEAERRINSTLQIVQTHTAAPLKKNKPWWKMW